MKLTFLQLKKIFPEINRVRILPSRIIPALVIRNIEFHIIPNLEELGTCVTLAGREYVFLTDVIAGCFTMKHWHTKPFTPFHTLQLLFSGGGIISNRR